MSNDIDRLDEQERREMLDWQRDELNLLDIRDLATARPIWMLALMTEDETEQRCSGCGKWVNTQQSCRYCEQDLTDMRRR